MNQANQLAEEFPHELLGRLPKAGGLDYVPVAEVITRLNRVLGVGGWGYRVDNLWRDPEDSNWVIASVELRATVDGDEAIRYGVGGYDTSNTGMDTADGYKSAVSEALKKAAQTLGVGLHLSRKEEAIAMDAMGHLAPQVAVKAFTDAMAEETDDFKKAVKKFAADQGIKWNRIFHNQLESLIEFAETYVDDRQELDESIN